MKIILLILLSLYFIPNKVFGNMYDLNSDKQINKTMKWNCPGGDFSWQYFDQNLKKEEPDPKGEEIYEWFPPHYKIDGTKKIFPGKMKIYTSDKDMNFLVENLEWERLDNNYLGRALFQNFLGINGVVSVTVHFNGKNIFAAVFSVDGVESNPFGFFSTGKCSVIN